MNCKWWLLVIIHIWPVITADKSHEHHEYPDHTKACIDILKRPIRINETVNKPGAKCFRN